MATVPVGIIGAVPTAVGRPDLIMPIIAGIGQSAAASTEVASALEAFLYNVGSSSPNEWETCSNSWEIHPELTLSAILLAMVEGEAETHGQLGAAIASSAAWRVRDQDVPD